MQLYFTCPEKKVIFSSDDYFLNSDHCIVEDVQGVKELQGTVRLNSNCPLCGEKHTFSVKDVLCPLSGENDER